MSSASTPTTKSWRKKVTRKILFADGSSDCYEIMEARFPDRTLNKSGVVASTPTARRDTVFRRTMYTNLGAVPCFFKAASLARNQSLLRPATQPRLHNFRLGGYDKRNAFNGNNVCQAHECLFFGVQRLLGLRVHAL
jgi:hypothetical protein